MKAERVQALILKRSQRWPSMPHITVKKDDVRRARPSNRPPIMRTGQVAAYVILDEHDAVVYAGQTANPTARMTQHRCHGRLTSTCSVVWLVCRDREAALNVEDLAISVLNPRDNIRGREFQWENERGMSLAELESLPIKSLDEAKNERGAA